MTIVWLDGRFLPAERALLPATDAALLHGRGLFESLRAYGGFPFRLADHVERMRGSARRFGIPFKPPKLDAVVPELCRRNRVRDAIVRLTLSAEGHLLVHSRPRRRVPAWWYSRGAEVMVAPWRRDPRSPLAGHKTLSYLENVLTHEEARRRGCADALFVGLRGELLEGCITNVFLVVKGRLITPSARRGILPGVTRKTVMQIERVKERTVKLRELWTADEAFLTSSGLEVLPIVKPPGPVTRLIMQAYRIAVREEIALQRRGRGLSS